MRRDAVLRKEKEESTQNILKKSIFFLEDYMENGNFNKSITEYNMDESFIEDYMDIWKWLILKKCPDLWNSYRVKREELAKLKYVEAKKEDPRSDDMDEMFNTMPKEIKYDDFLIHVLKFDTKTLTGEKLVEMANLNGIKVIMPKFRTIL